MKKRFEIRWNGEVVGFMNNPNWEMFETYGIWEPLPGAVSEPFVQLIEAGEEDPAVELYDASSGATTRGYVTFLLEDDISVKSYPGDD